MCNYMRLNQGIGLLLILNLKLDCLVRSGNTLSRLEKALTDSNYTELLRHKGNDQKNQGIRILIALFLFFFFFTRHS